MSYVLNYRIFRKHYVPLISYLLGNYYYFNEYCYRLLFIIDRSLGVSHVKRNQELIISLTTIPERIEKVNLTINTLMRQTLKPDRIILWLSECDMPERKINVDNLPPDLLGLQKRGLEIRWYKDIGSYRKIIPTLHAFPNALIVTADDDVFYPRNWLSLLYEAYLLEPQFIHCHRAHYIKYDSTGSILPYLDWSDASPGYTGPSLELFPTGVAGVLYAPGHLDQEVMNEEAFLKLCPKADDVWLKAMSLLANVSCKKVMGNSFKIKEIMINNNYKLGTENVKLGGNDRQINNVKLRYNVFKRLMH